MYVTSSSTTLPSASLDFGIDTLYVRVAAFECQANIVLLNSISFLFRTLFIMCLVEAGLSGRGNANYEPGRARERYGAIFNNLYHPKTNPTGLVNLGISENVRNLLKFSSRCIGIKSRKSRH